MTQRRLTNILAVALVAFALVSCRKDQPVQNTGTPAKTTTTQQPAQKQAEEQETQGVSVGQTMPDYSAQDLDGNKVSAGDFRGKTVLVNVWATWCGPCRYEIPDLIALKQKYGSRGFEILGVSIDDEGEIQSVRDFVKKEKMNYSIAYDPKAEILTLFNTSVIPTSVLLDRSGKIVWMHSSVLSAENAEFTTALEKALAQ